MSPLASLRARFGGGKPHNGGEAASPSHSRHARGHAAEPYTMSKRPSVGLWLKHTWRDILTMAIMGALGLGIYMLRPVPNRSFPVTFADGEVVYPQFAYPLLPEVVPIWLAAFLASMIPIFIFALMQIRVRSFWDFNNAVIGLLYSLISAALFQVFIKWLIGGLRPHFLEVCRPDPTKIPATGYGQLFFTREICTGDEKKINDALESFPSGHTTAAFAGFVYLYLYLNAKLKVFSNYHPAMWKLALIYAPILGAILIGGALTIDKFHNWYDVIGGAIIGSTFAFSAYRMSYAAIWDWRYNHIPLSRVAPYDYGVGGGFSELPTNAVATRKANWGAHGGHGSKEARHGFGNAGHHHGAPVAGDAGALNGNGGPMNGHGGVTNGHGVPVTGHGGTTHGATDGFMQPRRPVGASEARDPAHVV